jgi:hypothetical protein
VALSPIISVHGGLLLFKGDWVLFGYSIDHIRGRGFSQERES